MSYVMILNSLEMWSFEMMVLLSGLLPNPALETSVLSIRLLQLQFKILEFFHIFFLVHEVFLTQI